MAEIKQHTVWRVEHSRQIEEDRVTVTQTYHRLVVDGVMMECYSTDHELARPSGAYILSSTDRHFLERVARWWASKSGDEFFDEEETRMEEPEDLKVFEADFTP